MPGIWSVLLVSSTLMITSSLGEIPTYKSLILPNEDGELETYYTYSDPKGRRSDITYRRTAEKAVETDMKDDGVLKTITIPGPDGKPETYFRYSGGKKRRSKRPSRRAPEKTEEAAEKSSEESVELTVEKEKKILKTITLPGPDGTLETYYTLSDRRRQRARSPYRRVAEKSEDTDDKSAEEEVPVKGKKDKKILKSILIPRPDGTLEYYYSYSALPRRRSKNRRATPKPPVEEKDDKSSEDPATLTDEKDKKNIKTLTIAGPDGKPETFYRYSGAKRRRSKTPSRRDIKTPEVKKDESSEEEAPMKDKKEKKILKTITLPGPDGRLETYYAYSDTKRRRVYNPFGK